MLDNEKSMIVERVGLLVQQFYQFKLISQQRMEQIDKEREKQLRESAQESEFSDLVLSYVFSSNFFQYLRHTYRHFLHLQDDEKKNLIKSAEIFRIKEDKSTMIINYNQPTISILIYGELKCKQKVYSKGGYFMSGEEKIEVEFLKKTSIVMLNRKDFESTIEFYEEYYTKKAIVERILPVEILGLQKRGFKYLSEHTVIVEETNKNDPIISKDSRQFGLYILFEGSFGVISKKDVKLTQVSSDYFGEECLWNDHYEFYLKPESYEYKYMFIPKDICLQVFQPDRINKLKEYFEKKCAMRVEIENKYEENLVFTQMFLKASPGKKLKKRFSEKQVQEFNNILGKMTKRIFKPKWKLEEDKIQEEKVKKMKEKRIYMPKKPKSKYFSTLQDTTFDSSYHQLLHKEEEEKEYQPKLHLHERAKTEIVFKRNLTQQLKLTGRTEPASPEKGQRIRAATSHGYYSHNYDRSYSMGMMNLAKMKKYDQMKKTSTLKRGQKILTIHEMTKALSESFQKLDSKLRSSARDRKLDPQVFLNRTIKRNKLLADKLMQSRGGFTTWR